MPISESLPIVNLTPVILKTFLKYIFEVGVNRKFDFRWVGMFCWDLSNVISGGNWLFRLDFVFSAGTLPFCEQCFESIFVC